MNENTANTELLIQYLDGELDESQLDSVSKSLEQNADLRAELENLKLAREAVHSYGLRSGIKSIHGEMMKELKTSPKSESGTVRRMLPMGLRIAATLIILLGLSALYQYLMVTPEKLFTENFQEFTLREIRGSSENALGTTYKTGNMQAVIQEFNNMKSPGAEDYFLAGNAFLSNHNPAKAIESFLTLQQLNKNNNTHFFEDDAEYYLALSYLASHEPSKALPILENIHNDSNHPYHSRVSIWFMSKLRRTV